MWKKRHKNKFIECATSVVYCIPLTCGKNYIGQTGKCVNDSLRGSWRFPCPPLSEMRLVSSEIERGCYGSRSKCKRTRLVMERKNSSIWWCMHPSISLSTKELEYLCASWMHSFCFQLLNFSVASKVSACDCSGIGYVDYTMYTCPMTFWVI